VILLVQHNPNDVAAIERAFSEAEVNNEIAHCSHGEAAIAFLRNESNPKPVLILLDLDLPDGPGLDVLRRIKAEPRVSAIPVIVVTPTDDEQRIDESYACGANSYWLKPNDHTKLVEAVARLKGWLEIMELGRTRSPDL